MIYSRAAFGDVVERLIAENPDIAAAGSAVCVEHLDGAPLSFLLASAARRLRGLAESVPVVPTTTRTIAQFQRIRLPGAPWRYAITSNGGNILRDGEPDPQWRASVAAEVEASGVVLAEVTSRLRGLIDDSWVDKFRVADELFCYLVVRPDAVPRDFVATWGAWCAQRGWSVSQQGRKIYMMPNAVCKSAAVAEVRRRLHESGELSAEATLLAAGDGALDAEMLRAADLAIRPRHGELEYLSWTNPNLTITEAVGIRAGEEIIEWFYDHSMRPAALGVE
ncbi:HAD family hydrolase [Nocardia callitridis]